MSIADQHALSDEDLLNTLCADGDVLKIIRNDADKELVQHLVSQYTELGGQDTKSVVRRNIFYTVAAMVSFLGIAISLATLLSPLVPLLLLLLLSRAIYVTARFIYTWNKCVMCKSNETVSHESYITPKLCSKCLSDEQYHLRVKNIPSETRVEAMKRLKSFVVSNAAQASRNHVYKSVPQTAR